MPLCIVMWYMYATQRAGGSEADQTQRYAGGGKPHMRFARVSSIFPLSILDIARTVCHWSLPDGPGKITELLWLAKQIKNVR